MDDTAYQRYLVRPNPDLSSTVRSVERSLSVEDHEKEVADRFGFSTVSHRFVSDSDNIAMLVSHEASCSPFFEKSPCTAVSRNC